MHSHPYTSHAPGSILLASSSSLDTAVTLSMPTTPTPANTHVATPLAPHLPFNGAGTRYPLTRSDSTATVIIDSAPSLYPASSSTLSVKSAHSSSSASSTQALAPSASAQVFREPFDPMEPTEHLDSQLAALRSIISASALPISLPPTPPAALTGAPGGGGGSSGGGAGLTTYDAFCSAHVTATASYRSLLVGQSTRGGSGTPGPAPLQAHASAPSILATSVSAKGQDGATQESGGDDMGTVR